MVYPFFPLSFELILESKQFYSSSSTPPTNDNCYYYHRYYYCTSSNRLVFCHFGSKGDWQQMLLEKLLATLRNIFLQQCCSNKCCLVYEGLTHFTPMNIIIYVYLSLSDHVICSFCSFQLNINILNNIIFPVVLLVHM